MNKKIYLASPHMSDEGYEQEYVKEAFDTNWIAPLGLSFPTISPGTSNWYFIVSLLL